MSEHKRKATIWFVMLFLVGGMALIWVYLYYFRWCGGPEGC